MNTILISFLLISFALSCNPPCNAGGVCIDGKCVCRSGWSGPNCLERGMNPIFQKPNQKKNVQMELKMVQPVFVIQVGSDQTAKLVKVLMLVEIITFVIHLLGS